jgi:hypothetical protein
VTDDVPTRWVTGAGGLASLLAPQAQAGRVHVPPEWPRAARREDASAPADAVSAGMTPVTWIEPAAPAATPDVETFFDELERRLELEYLRHYGTSAPVGPGGR